MINYKKIDDLINKHFDGTHKEKITENLKKYESDLDTFAEQEAQERKNTLVDLIFNSRAFEIKDTDGFLLENGGASRYHISLIEIVEDRKGQELAELMARYMDQVDEQIDRVVGILKKSRNQKGTSKEDYHLSSIIATVLEKRSCDLIYQRTPEDKFDFWQDGRLSDHKRIAIVDEVITTGTGVIEAVKYLRKFRPEISINDVFVYVSRATGQKLKDIQSQLEQLEVKLHYIIDERELIDALHSKGYIDIDSIQSS